MCELHGGGGGIFIIWCLRSVNLFSKCSLYTWLHPLERSVIGSFNKAVIDRFKRSASMVKRFEIYRNSTLIVLSD